MTSAASKAAALLHKLDEGRSARAPMTHAPHCPGGPLVTSRGFSVLITTCSTCKAVETVRHVHQTPSTTNPRKQD